MVTNDAVEVAFFEGYHAGWHAHEDRRGYPLLEDAWRNSRVHLLVDGAPQPLWPSAEELAALFHEVYEELAPAFGYATREATAVPLMVAMVERVVMRLSRGGRERD